MPAEAYTYQGFTIHTRTGMIPDDDRGIVQEVVNEYFWERLPDTVRFAIDIGAHIGSWSCYLARRYPDAQIAAIEPNPDNFALLAHNAQQYPGIGPICGAVTTYSQPRLHVDDTNSGGHVVTAEGRGGCPVKAFTLDAFIVDAGQIDVLKIDCEECEFDVLLTSDTLDCIGIILGEYHSSQRVFEDTIGRHLRQWFAVETYPVLPWNRRGLFFAKRLEA